MQQLPEALTFERLLQLWTDAGGNEKATRGISEMLILSNRRGWFHACRNAVRAQDVDTIQAWLGEEPPIPQLKAFVFGDRYRLPVLRVHLECALVAVELTRHRWPSVEDAKPIISAAARAATELGKGWNQTADPVGQWDSAALADSFLDSRWPEAAYGEPAHMSDVVVELLRLGLYKPPQISLAFLKDLTREMLSAPGADAAVPSILNTSTGSALFTKSGDGVPGTLTMELLPHGHGEFYPATEFAFVSRGVGSPEKPNFRESEITAPAAALSEWGAVVVRQSGPEPMTIAKRWETHDIRWRLSLPKDELIRELEGPSLGALFALHIGHLLAR